VESTSELGTAVPLNQPVERENSLLRNEQRFASAHRQCLLPAYQLALSPSVNRSHRRFDWRVPSRSLRSHLWPELLCPLPSSSTEFEETEHWSTLTSEQLGNNSLVDLFLFGATPLGGRLRLPQLDPSSRPDSPPSFAPLCPLLFSFGSQLLFNRPRLVFESLFGTLLMPCESCLSMG
jgi:hypothetical protein